ncbi:hypothetical protein B9Q04_04890 [Candidatus Marsarchaeota G2 archaeon BE_D]|uniref:Archease domain-containing protein n=4 Tax=Candidatus Marsarchaeota group 2 TaxID=2203771 RepID=A0A2R6CCK4_9ARCH|nr:MAG: hypothetical protein B9Q06_09760 [Candidatus Marsarchaeota G2 archaeon ECH_B_2]PSO00799.1 MAG: hypothetical protein B9Q05_09955 [Candidatus Marsarchaeota G2 archaeon ECH_B_1]PSO08571.1 MAG: hypothetical protein B9Q04_04890 [Candidatus Marsarchaeota G2 archaeon BE_D]
MCTLIDLTLARLVPRVVEAYIDRNRITLRRAACRGAKDLSSGDGSVRRLRVMPFRYLEDVAIADLAFEAESESLEGLFEDAAMALFEAMANTATLRAAGKRRIVVRADTVEDLLYKFLSEVVYLKDAEALLFKNVDVAITVNGGYTLVGEGEYDVVDPSRQELRMDVKAVTYHMFRVEKRDGSWVCTVVVDV